MTAPAPPMAASAAIAQLFIGIGIFVGSMFGAAVAGLATAFVGFATIEGSSVDTCDSNEWCFGGPDLLAALIILAISAAVALVALVKLFAWGDRRWRPPPAPPAPGQLPVHGP